VVPKNSELEISHHYGLESFQDFGSVMITVINRDYCKKLIFLQPNQYHPEMFHKVKDETFFILYGEVNLKLDGKLIVLKEGDSISIPPNSIHGFGSKNGAIIEEVSSNHQSSDSYYLDEKITDNKNRKTIVHYWL
jgi:quercetin dioxygenase-like cupin family protein